MSPAHAGMDRTAPHGDCDRLLRDRRHPAHRHPSDLVQIDPGRLLVQRLRLHPGHHRRADHRLRLTAGTRRDRRRTGRPEDIAPPPQGVVHPPGNPGHSRVTPPGSPTPGGLRDRAAAFQKRNRLERAACGAWFRPRPQSAHRQSARRFRWAHTLGGGGVIAGAGSARGMPRPAPWTRRNGPPAKEPLLRRVCGTNVHTPMPSRRSGSESRAHPRHQPPPEGEPHPPTLGGKARHPLGPSPGGEGRRSPLRPRHSGIGEKEPPPPPPKGETRAPTSRPQPSPDRYSPGLPAEGSAKRSAAGSEADRPKVSAGSICPYPIAT